MYQNEIYEEGSWDVIPEEGICHVLKQVDIVERGLSKLRVANAQSQVYQKDQSTLLNDTKKGELKALIYLENQHNSLNSKKGQAIFQAQREAIQAAIARDMHQAYQQKEQPKNKQEAAAYLERRFKFKEALKERERKKKT